MTTITISKTSSGCYREFICSGHAGYAGAGSDVVCAAVSVLVINTVNSLEKLAKEHPEVKQDEEKGLIVCRFLQEPNEKSDLLLKSMELGLQEISRQYGARYLKLKIKEV